jgi:hypothetical protein
MPIYATVKKGSVPVYASIKGNKSKRTSNRSNNSIVYASINHE